MNEQDIESRLREGLGELKVMSAYTQAFNSLVDICLMKGVYERLPIPVQRTSKNAYTSAERHQKAIARVQDVCDGQGSFEEKLKAMFAELSGDIRNSACFFALLDFCERENENLPDEVKKMLYAATKAKEGYFRANERIGRMLEKEGSKAFNQYLGSDKK
jgi:hypothetical protein